VYKGIYHGSKKHEGDLEAVLERAWNIGMQKIIITGGSLEESREALQLANSHGLFLIWLKDHDTFSKVLILPIS
jgi:TatD DNase family protein